MPARRTEPGRARLAVACAIALAAGACSYDPGPPPPLPPPSSEALGEQLLAWDQPVLAGTQIERYRFVAYVDGVRTDLVDASCTGPASASGVHCTAELPALVTGRHVVTLAAVYAAPGERPIEGPPSLDFVVTRR